MPPRRAVSAPLAAALCALAAVLGAALLAGCGPDQARWGRGAAATPSAGVSTAAPTGSGPAPSAAAGQAPATAFAVGVRSLPLKRGDRPLRTVVWYPAGGEAGGSARSGAPVADGRFPVLLFSHGLGGDPEDYAAGTTRLAAAGFVVVAPAYPYTSSTAHPVNPIDVVNQPADASAVLDAVLALDGTEGDPLAGHLRVAEVAALGHSAGGYTTTGLLGIDRDRRLVAGVVIAGGAIGSFQGPPAKVLFVHGDADPVVGYSAGRSAYDRVPWPKAFLTEVGGGHVDYLSPGSRAFAPTITTITDFLRGALYHDAAANARLARDATAGGVTKWDARL